MIGIIADTHDNIPKIIRAVEIFKERDVELVLHLGDVIAPVTALYFKGLNIKFISGNCDGDIEMLKNKINEINGEFLGLNAELEINNKKIFIIHKPEFNEINRFDYVFHGHTHKKKDEKINNTRIINPGGLYSGNEENSIAILDLDNDKLEFIDI